MLHVSLYDLVTLKSISKQIEKLSYSYLMSRVFNFAIFAFANQSLANKYPREINTMVRNLNHKQLDKHD